MQDARTMVLQELEAMLAQVKPIAATAFARLAGVAPSTVTRFINGQTDTIPGNRTMTALRNARDAILAERAAPLDLHKLTKNADKRALIALLLAADDDQVARAKHALNGIPEAPAPQRKRHDLG